MVKVFCLHVAFSANIQAKYFHTHILHHYSISVSFSIMPLIGNQVFVSRCSHVDCTSLDRIMDGGQGQLLKKWYPSERVMSGVAGLSKGSHNPGGGGGGGGGRERAPDPCPGEMDHRCLTLGRSS